MLNNFFIFFLKFKNIKETGFKNIFFNIFVIILIGNNSIFIIVFNIFFINEIIFTFIFIKVLLINIKFIVTPNVKPKNIYHLISPLLNINMEYTSIIPAIIQYRISCKMVIKSDVLKLFLNILNISNNIVNNIPTNVKIKKLYNWLFTIVIHPLLI